MVMVKLGIILLVIGAGIFYIDIDNWTPFMPNGFTGVMGGVAAVFFAYIGFDAVSTLAEESKNPQRDLPRGMMYSLIVCTVLYIALSLVLTGMVSFSQLNVSDPLAEVFKLKAVKWMLFIVSIGAVVAMTSVLLVFQMGQPRIWMSMSRDGLLPKKFSSIHPKYKTPGFATIVTGLVVGIPLFFTDENFVLDFTSIGTLFAFVLVCGGVMMLPQQKEKIPGRFNLPYINSKWIAPIALIVTLAALWKFNPEFLSDTFRIDTEHAAQSIPMLIFFILCIVMSISAFIKNLSLIPLLGVISCCYLLTGMAVSNWKWFFTWLLAGLVIYLLYGRKKSKLNTKSGD
jgi:amino acid transporter